MTTPMQRAITRLTGGDFAGAIADFTSLLRLEPDNADAYANRGSAYFHSGDFVHALPDFTQAIHLGLRASSLYYLRGRAYGALGKHTEALADYDESLHLDANNHQTLAYRGNHFNIIGQPKRGLPDLDKAIALQPNNLDYHGMRGVVRAGSGDFDGAAADFSAIIKSGKAHADIYFYRGHALLSKRNILVDEARAGLNDYRQALRMAPNHAQAQLMRQSIERIEVLLNEMGNKEPASVLKDQAFALQRSGDLNGALLTLRQALTISPRDARLHSHLSLIYKLLKQYENAVTSAAQAIALDPSLAEAYTNRAMAYIVLGRTPEALADLNTAISMGVKGLYGLRLSVITDPPPELMDLNNEALALAQNNRMNEARAKFDEIIRRAPDYSGGYGNRGNVARQTGDHRGALKDYTKAIELNGQNAYALFGRAMTYLRDDPPDYQRAEADLTAAIAVNPEMGIFYRYRGMVRLDAAHYAEAIQDLEAYGEMGGWTNDKAFIEEKIALTRNAMR